MHWVRAVLDRSPVYHSANTYRQTNTFTPTGTLKSPIHLTCMSLGYRRKPQQLQEKKHTDMQRTCKLHRECFSLVWAGLNTIFSMYESIIRIFSYICRCMFVDFYLSSMEFKVMHTEYTVSLLSACLQLHCTLILQFFHSLSSKHLSASRSFPWEPLSVSFYPGAFLCLRLILYSHH